MDGIVIFIPKQEEKIDFLKSNAKIMKFNLQFSVELDGVGGSAAATAAIAAA